MKRVSIAVVVLLIIIIAAVTTGQQENNRRFGQYPCGSYGSVWQSYWILEDELLSEIKNQVRQGMDKAGWQPLGGVVYDTDKKRYLQVMVHPRKIPEYP